MSDCPSEPVNGRAGCVKLMLARHERTLEIARTLATMGEDFIAGSEVRENEPHRFIPVCLAIRQISGLRSLCLLAVNGFYTEALGHQRILMEALSLISALARKPELVNDYFAQEILNQNKMLNDILSFRTDWGLDIPRDPPDEELRRMISKNHTWLEVFRNTHGRRARDVKTFAWAQTGGVLRLLLGRYVIASEALHLAPKSLNRLLVMDEDRIAALRIGPEDEDLDRLILNSCRYVFVGIRTLASILEVDVPAQIDSLYDRFKAEDVEGSGNAEDASPEW